MYHVMVNIGWYEGFTGHCADYHSAMEFARGCKYLDNVTQIKVLDKDYQVCYIEEPNDKLFDLVASG